MNKEILLPVICKIGGNNVLKISSSRIPIQERETDLNYYEVRHDSISMKLQTVEEEVKHYFFCSIVTDEPINHHYLLKDEDIQAIYKNV